MARVRHATLEEGRLEQPRVLTANDLSTRDSGEISRPLMLAASAERLSEAEQNQHPGEQGRQYAEQEQRGLVGLGVQHSQLMRVRSHRLGRSRYRSYGSTRLCDKERRTLD
jgi:hypothetical protein